MNNPRIAISKALYELLIAIPPPGKSDWAFTERGLTGYDTLQASQQPYLGVFCDNQKATQNQALGTTKWELHYWVQIYLLRSQQDTNFGDTVDEFIDAIDAALISFPQANTLGGLVTGCFIEGEVLANPSLPSASGQAAIMLPITVISGN